jgi:hypothetical protein
MHRFEPFRICFLLRSVYGALPSLAQMGDGRPTKLHSLWREEHYSTFFSKMSESSFAGQVQIAIRQGDIYYLLSVAGK